MQKVEGKFTDKEHPEYVYRCRRVCSQFSVVLGHFSGDFIGRFALFSVQFSLSFDVRISSFFSQFSSSIRLLGSSTWFGAS